MHIFSILKRSSRESLTTTKASIWALLPHLSFSQLIGFPGTPNVKESTDHAAILFILSDQSIPHEQFLFTDEISSAWSDRLHSLICRY